MMGYYDNLRRRPNDEFELLDVAEFSHIWMVALDFEPPAPSPAAGKLLYEDSERKKKNAAKKAKKKLAQAKQAVASAQADIDANEKILEGVDPYKEQKEKGRAQSQKRASETPVI